MSDFTPPLDEGRDASPAARGAGFNGEAADGLRIPANRDRSVARRISVDSSRSMRAITGEVAALLDGLEERPRQCGALLASELIAQVAGPTRHRDCRSIEFTVQRRANAVHLEAMGPVAPALAGTADHDVASPDPNTDWGAFLFHRLADRWGLSGGYRGAI
jgi:hypothetical protein